MRLTRRNERGCWSGRRDSNPRRPAWETGTLLCPQHLRVSDALFRLTQVSPYQSFPVLTLLIEVGSRYIVFVLVPCFVLHPMVINNNGPGWNASHRPIGVKSEFSQRQYTPPSRRGHLLTFFCGLGRLYSYCAQVFDSKRHHMKPAVVRREQMLAFRSILLHFRMGISVTKSSAVAAEGFVGTGAGHGRAMLHPSNDERQGDR